MRHHDDEPVNRDPGMKTGLVVLLLILAVLMIGGVPASLWMLKLRQHEAVEAERRARDQAQQAAEEAARQARDAEERARAAPKE